MPITPEEAALLAWQSNYDQLETRLRELNAFIARSGPREAAADKHEKQANGWLERFKFMSRMSVAFLVGALITFFFNQTTYVAAYLFLATAALDGLCFGVFAFHAKRFMRLMEEQEEDWRRTSEHAAPDDWPGPKP